MSDAPQFDGLLTFPRIKVQNVNCISSPLTWGFPSMTAFMGLMWALERRLAGREEGGEVLFSRVGVVCHAFQPHVSDDGFSHTFHLTRNPVGKDGKTAPIIEEGRANMEISLVFGVQSDVLGDAVGEQQMLARQIGDFLFSMRIAGGSILPMAHKPFFTSLGEEWEGRLSKFRSVRRRLLPGFTLIGRDDLLKQRHDDLLQEDPNATPLDAWLDMSRINWRCSRIEEVNEDTGEVTERGEWKRDAREGWIVPIPVGYTALSPRYDNSVVDNTRDDSTSFQFVESIYSLGQWVGPHHLSEPADMLWHASYDEENGVYRCINKSKSM